MRKLVVIASMVVTAFATFADTEVVDGVEWKFSGSDGKVTIEGVVDETLPQTGKLVFPSKLGGWSVGIIGRGVFRGKSGIKSVVLPCTVNRIGEAAFQNCPNLENVQVFGPSYMDSDVFMGCTRLRKVELNDRVKIGNRAFMNCVSLTQVDIPGVNAQVMPSVPDFAFSGCVLLTSVTFRAGIYTVGQEAFEGCSAIEKVALPDGLNFLSHGAFKSCRNLREVVLPNTLTSLYLNPFENCFRLKKVVFLGKAPRGLPMHWFYGADIICYEEFAPSYTNVNPNAVIRPLNEPLKKLCGVTFKNADKFVRLVDEKATVRAKANAAKWAEIDAKAMEVKAKQEVSGFMIG